MTATSPLNTQQNDILNQSTTSKLSHSFVEDFSVLCRRFLASFVGFSRVDQYDSVLFTSAFIREINNLRENGDTHDYAKEAYEALKKATRNADETKEAGSSSTPLRQQLNAISESARKKVDDVIGLFSPFNHVREKPSKPKSIKAPAVQPEETVQKPRKLKSSPLTKKDPIKKDTLRSERPSVHQRDPVGITLGFPSELVSVCTLLFHIPVFRWLIIESDRDWALKSTRTSSTKLGKLVLAQLALLFKTLEAHDSPNPLTLDSFVSFPNFGELVSCAQNDVVDCFLTIMSLVNTAFQSSGFFDCDSFLFNVQGRTPNTSENYSPSVIVSLERKSVQSALNELVKQNEHAFQQLSRLPPILFIELDRWKTDLHGGQVYDRSPYEISESLTIADPQNQVNDQRDQTKGDSDENKLRRFFFKQIPPRSSSPNIHYILVGIVVDCGKTGTGPFRTIIRPLHTIRKESGQEEWWSVTSSSSSRISPDEVLFAKGDEKTPSTLNSDAHLLMYCQESYLPFLSLLT
ncbi:hypothetical protein BLNAU_13733 [Blattamonas nauphoetae]|uniref:Peptidase C19 ubiquitin carboxyl-terminal hydrolase domain-containing protein n=1 Tax=Blattamonas nauphoetae TaxID=2049346 RepID=A0ABQ9XKJ6_9EUKA|nr:hypothetical protein BLNAU_13733 [Blattamonas nauphoetae]